MFNDYAKSLFNFLKNVSPEYFRNFEYIMAQWCYETGYFKSDLATKYFNPAGMKWRPELKEVATCSPADYTDWENETDAYAKVDNIVFSPYLYFRFVQRWPYKGYEDFAGDGIGFISHLAFCGWCGSIDGVNTDHFINEEDRKRAIAFKYLSNIREVYNSKKFTKLLTDFYRIYIDVASVKSITIDDLPFTCRG